MNNFDGEVKLTTCSRLNLYNLFLHDALARIVEDGTDDELLAKGGAYYSSEKCRRVDFCL
ncbi:hypothetical protein [Nostoc sp.]|uniref:hypothetical protein n=1 Tax=Nostoc sp. TaxID=1180 RepID=UPI002FF4D248